MADEPKQEPKQKPQPARPEAIAIATLVLVEPIDGIGRDGYAAIKGGGEQHRARWEITYHPHMRHHRIEYYPPGAPDFHHPTCFAATLPAPNAL